MSRHLISLLAKSGGLSLRATTDLMLDGVAFIRDDNSHYDVFSHEGDHIGVIRTVDVEYAVSYIKRHGIEVGKCLGYYKGEFSRNRPGFTFAWRGWHV